MGQHTFFMPCTPSRSCVFSQKLPCRFFLAFCSVLPRQIEWSSLFRTRINVCTLMPWLLGGRVDDKHKAELADIKATHAARLRELEVEMVLFLNIHVGSIATDVLILWSEGILFAWLPPQRIGEKTYVTPSWSQHATVLLGAHTRTHPHTPTHATIQWHLQVR